MTNHARGAAFEKRAAAYFETQGIHLTPNYVLEIGFAKKHRHRFDLGNSEQVVEVKCFRWMSGSRHPSAKISTLTEALLFLHLAPEHYRKVLFCLSDKRGGTGETLLNHFVRTRAHLIPPNVELLEFEEATGRVLIGGAQ